MAQWGRTHGWGAKTCEVVGSIPGGCWALVSLSLSLSGASLIRYLNEVPNY